MTSRATAPAAAGLPKRWYPLRRVEAQLGYALSPHRFNVVPAGRRSGKTERAKRKLISRAMSLEGIAHDETPRFFAGAPTRDQAKRIYWDDLKAMSRPWWSGRPSETELLIRLLNGSEIIVVGMDKPERIEGSPWDGGVLDEYANMKPQAWGANVRPALSDRNGWCDLIGVPEGRNHYYDAYAAALAEMMERGPASEWGAYTWTSAEVLPAEEIAAAAKDLDARTFEQEYGASFVNFEGRAYYAFADANKARLRDRYDPAQPLIICLDFNVEPGVAAICQELPLPNGLIGTAVIGEVWIDNNSNTPAVCRRLLADWKDHRGRVEVFGDATGGQRRTSGTMGSDWDIVRKDLRTGYTAEGVQGFGTRVSFSVKPNNPAERARVNAVNSRTLASDGTIRLMVDPSAAPHVVKDLEGVRTLKGGSGEIDKKIDKRLTHMCFAPGTMVDLETGPCAIEAAPATGRVRTWDGSFVPYLNVGRTIERANILSVRVSDGTVVYCTPEHQWLTPLGWRCARDLTGHRLSDWRSSLTQLPAKHSTGRSSTDTKARSAISAAPTAWESSTSTASSGPITTGLSRRATTFTTATAIGRTIKTRIFSSCFRKHTSATTNGSIPSDAPRPEAPVWRWLARLPRRGMEAMRGVPGTRPTTPRTPSNSRPAASDARASTAGQGLWPRGSHSSAVASAKRPSATTPRSTTRNASAWGVAVPSRRTDTPARAIAAEGAPRALSVIDVAPAGTTDVYCLHVPVHGCFALANGAIVSNSDALGYYVEYRFPVVDGAWKQVRAAY